MMAGHSRDREIRDYKKDRDQRAEYYLGSSERDSSGRDEIHAPYKLEPNVSEIENFLARLRQEGL